jgi:hypothetical protein
LEVEQLHRVLCVAQVRRVLTSAVNADAEVLDAGLANGGEGETRIVLRVVRRYEVRWHRARVLAEAVGERLERRILPHPERLLGTQVARR